MKDSLKYLKLWQKKRSELQINDEPQGDWLQMKSLLDENMPVDPPASGGKPPRGFGFKLLTLFISCSAAAMVYLGVHHIHAKNHQHKNHNRYTKHASGFIKDSTRLDSIAQLQTDSIISAKEIAHDSSGNIRQAKNEVDSATMQSAIAKNNSNESARNTINKRSPAMFANKRLPFDSDHGRNQPGDSGSNRNGKSHSYRNMPGISRVNSDNSSRSFGLQPGDDMTGSAQNNVNINLLKSLNPSYPFLQPLVSPKLMPDLDLDAGGFSRITPAAIKRPKPDKQVKGKTPKNSKNPDSKGSSNFEWGLMVGANTSGSFTPKNQNSNIYGSLPADVYAGPYVTYNAGNKLGLNVQLKLLSPQQVSGSYKFRNGSKADTSLKIISAADSRKIYSVEVPLYVEYKATKSLKLKAGPVFSIPVKQFGGKAAIQQDTIRKDSAYFVNTTSALNKAKYAPKLNYGISAGVALHVDRWSFEATYLKRLNNQKISSDLGSYQYSGNTLQIGIGFQLNKPKH